MHPDSDIDALAAHRAYRWYRHFAAACGAEIPATLDACSVETRAVLAHVGAVLPATHERTPDIAASFAAYRALLTRRGYPCPERTAALPHRVQWMLATVAETLAAERNRERHTIRRARVVTLRERLTMRQAG